MKPKRPTDANGKEMLNRQEICEELDCSMSWLQKVCNPKKIDPVIPHRRIGKNYWFVLEQVQEWNTNRKNG